MLSETELNCWRQGGSSSNKQRGELEALSLGHKAKLSRKISLYLYPLFGGWQECLGLLERDYVGGGSVAAELPVSMLTQGKDTSFPKAEKREWRLLVPR